VQTVTGGFGDGACTGRGRTGKRRNRAQGNEKGRRREKLQGHERGGGGAWVGGKKGGRGLKKTKKGDSKKKHIGKKKTYRYKVFAKKGYRQNGGEGNTEAGMGVEGTNAATSQSQRLPTKTKKNPG